MDKKKLFATIAACLKKEGAIKVSIFGSYARGDETKRSDIDVLVKFIRPIGFFKLVQIENDLSDLIGKKIDLVTEGSVHPLIKERIQDDLVILM